MATHIGHLSDVGQGLPISSQVPPSSAVQEKTLPLSSALQPIKQDGLLFEESLIASGAKVRPRNLWATAGSVALQSLLLFAVIVIPLFHTDMLPKRETLTMLYLQPPAAAPLGTGLRTPTRISRSPYTPTSSSIPSPVRRMQEDLPTSDGAIGGVVGGVPGGVIGGVPGGVLGQVLGNTRSAPVLAKAAEPAPKRIHVAARVEEANLIHDVTPAYPPEAGRARVEGTVVLLAVIGKDGRVQEVRVESGLPILAQAAIDAVKQWRYKPYMLNGEPVEVDSRITINFAVSS